MNNDILFGTEIADKETEIRCTWEEAVMHCFALGPGWRLPRLDELFLIDKMINDFEQRQSYWASDNAGVNQAFVRGFSLNVSKCIDKNSNSILVRAVRDL